MEFGVCCRPRAWRAKFRFIHYFSSHWWIYWQYCAGPSPFTSKIMLIFFSSVSISLSLRIVISFSLWVCVCMCVYYHYCLHAWTSMYDVLYIIYILFCLIWWWWWLIARPVNGPNAYTRTHSNVHPRRQHTMHNTKCAEHSLRSHCTMQCNNNDKKWCWMEQQQKNKSNDERRRKDTIKG